MDKIRLDLHLASQHRHYSRTQIKKLIEEGYVLVDGEKRKPGFILKGGEKIQMVRRAPEIPEAKPEDIPLSILYEDDDLLVINKPAGMVVHPAPGNVQGTVVNAVLHHLHISPPPPLTLRGGVAEWVDLITKICYDAELLKRIGTRARQYVKEAHDPERHYSKIIKMYEEVLRQ